MKLKIKTKHDMLQIKVKCDGVIREDTVQTLQRYEIKGLMRITQDGKELDYTAPACDTMRKYFDTARPAGEFFYIVTHVVAMARAFEYLNLSYAQLHLNPDEMFVSPATREMYLVYVPTTEPLEVMGLREMLWRMATLYLPLTQADYDAVAAFSMHLGSVLVVNAEAVEQYVAATDSALVAVMQQDKIRAQQMFGGQNEAEGGVGGAALGLAALAAMESDSRKEAPSVPNTYAKQVKAEYEALNAEEKAEQAGQQQPEAYAGNVPDTGGNGQFDPNAGYGQYGTNYGQVQYDPNTGAPVTQSPEAGAYGQFDPNASYGQYGANYGQAQYDPNTGAPVTQAPEAGAYGQFVPNAGYGQYGTNYGQAQFDPETGVPVIPASEADGAPPEPVVTEAPAEAPAEVGAPGTEESAEPEEPVAEEPVAEEKPEAVEVPVAEVEPVVQEPAEPEVPVTEEAADAAETQPAGTYGQFDPNAGYGQYNTNYGQAQFDPETGMPLAQPEAGAYGQFDPNAGYGQYNTNYGQAQFDPETGMPLKQPAGTYGQFDPNAGYAQYGATYGQAQFDPETGMPLTQPEAGAYGQFDPNTGYAQYGATYGQAQFDPETGAPVEQESVTEKAPVAEVLPVTETADSGQVNEPVRDDFEDDDVEYGATMLLEEEEDEPVMPTLTRRSTDESVTIDKPEYRIGKSKTSDYCVEGNAAVSRTHAEILQREGDFYIKDLGSTNHTFVNNHRLEGAQEMKLSNGDVIRLANEEFTFRQD